MSVELNHTIIPAKDKWVSAKFLADILNLEAGPEWGHFVPVKTANGVTLDFDTREEFRPGHYAFLVSDAEFDAAFARIRARKRLCVSRIRLPSSPGALRGLAKRSRPGSSPKAGRSSSTAAIVPRPRQSRARSTRRASVSPCMLAILLCRRPAKPS